MTYSIWVRNPYLLWSSGIWLIDHNRLNSLSNIIGLSLNCCLQIHLPSVSPSFHLYYTEFKHCGDDLVCLNLLLPLKERAGVSWSWEDFLTGKQWWRIVCICLLVMALFQEDKDWSSRFFLIMDLDGENLCFDSASELLCIQAGGSYGIRHQRPKAKLNPALHDKWQSPFRCEDTARSFPITL